MYLVIGLMDRYFFMEFRTVFISSKTIFMATIIPQPIGKSKTPLHAVKIDMTPMVDLGFLLITFFIFTTSLMEPTVTKLAMPKESKDTATLFEKTLLTMLVDKDNAYVYEGSWEKARA